MSTAGGEGGDEGEGEGGDDAGAAFPWDEAMAVGLGRLRLSPAAFWKMTPRELNAALGVHRAARVAAPERADLSALMRRFPDRGANGEGRRDG